MRSRNLSLSARFLVILACFSLSQLACKKDDELGSSQSFTIPSSQKATNPHELVEGYYSLESVTSSAALTYSGKKVKTFFEHQISNAGFPKKSDRVRNKIVGYNKKKGATLYVNAEMQVPLHVIAKDRAVHVEDYRYYWQQVRTDGSWSWQFNNSNVESKRGWDGRTLLTDTVNRKVMGNGGYIQLGSQSLLLVQDPQQNKITVYGEYKTIDGKVKVRLVYRRIKDAELSFRSIVVVERDRLNDLVNDFEADLEIPTTPPVTEKPIVLDDSEKKIGNLNSGGGIFFDHQSGTHRSYTDTRDASDYAVNQLGFDRQIVENHLTIGSRHNGVTGFVGQKADLIPTINGLISHMKQQMQGNNEDLELVFAIDTSGSMKEDIREVVSRLTEITRSMQNIIDSGRSVRIGLVEFNQPGKECCQLPLTSDMGLVTNALNAMLVNYTGNYSIEPGEACYHGLSCAANDIKWTSSNRQVILITDEASHEELTGQQDYIRSVEAMLAQARVYPVIVKIGNQH